MVVARVRYLVYLSSVAPQRIGLTLVAKTLRQKKRGCFNRRVTDWATAEFLLFKKVDPEEKPWWWIPEMDTRYSYLNHMPLFTLDFHTKITFLYPSWAKTSWALVINDCNILKTFAILHFMIIIKNCTPFY